MYKRFTVVSDNLLSIIILCVFITDQHEVPVMTFGTAQVVHKIGSILETSASLSSKKIKRFM